MSAGEAVACMKFAYALGVEGSSAGGTNRKLICCFSGLDSLTEPSYVVRNAARSGTMSTLFWPYRPREGYPSVPRWLYVLLLIVLVLAIGLILSGTEHQDWGPLA